MYLFLLSPLPHSCISSPIFPGLAFGGGAFKVMDGCNGPNGMFYPSTAIPVMPSLECGECSVRDDGTLSCIPADGSCPQLSPCTQAECVLQDHKSRCQNTPIQCPANMINAGFAAGTINPFDVGGENTVIPGRRRNAAQFFDQGLLINVNICIVSMRCYCMTSE